MKKVVLLFLLMFFSSSIYSQSYLDNFTGIPLITYGSGSNFAWLNWYEFDSLKIMGSEVFLAPDLWPSKFDVLRDSELKVIPWQIDTTMANYIAKYTDAVYTIWEAESSKVPTETGFQLIKSSNLYQYADGLKTTSNTDSGYIISGPKYYQRLDYSVEPEPIKYFIDFNIKIKSTVGVLPPIYLESNTDPVCRIELAVDGIAKIDSIIRVKDFDNFDAWKEFEIEYSKTDILESGSPLSISHLYISPGKSIVEVLKDVEFRIHYYLETNDYLALHVDNITVSDERGKDLHNNQNTQELLIAQATNGTGIPYYKKFTTINADFDSTVIGWYGVDEPSFIDNFACVKKVQELLNSITGGKKLITSIAGSSDGKVHWGADTYRIDELMKRAELEEIILNTYIYNYPKEQNEYDYKAYNIENMVKNHFDILNNYDVDFVVNLQTGLWFADSGHLEVIPSDSQFMNTAYLALLYGAKGLSLSKYFYNSGGDGITTGLFRVDTNYVQHVYQPLWFTIKNELSPVLKGRFGQTIKNLDQKYQVCNYPADMGTIISDSFWLKRIKTNLPPLEADQCRVDYGFFEDPNNLSYKFLMIVNRYYSTMTDLDITIKNLQGFRNWNVENFISDNSQTVFSNAANEATFNDLIDEGEAGFYSILPVLKYGGNLVYDDTVSTAITLSEEMTIKPNADLSIEALYTVASDIYVEDGGKIDVKWYYGNIDISSNGSIEFEDWADCLIGAKTTDLHHPRLIFNEYNSSYLQYYKIYKKYGSSAWAVIDTTSSTSYTDLNTTIVQPGGMGGVDVKFKICALIKIKNITYEEFTNEVTYPTSGQEIEKKGSENNGSEKPIIFALAQNHPNPFNPTTVITYQVPKQSYLTIKVYDILGKEVIELVNSTKEAGFYSVNYDASNLSSGTYIYRMEAGKYVESRKMIILK